MSEGLKYLTRFLVVAIPLLFLLLFLRGAEAVSLVSYKLVLVLLGIALAEVVWLTFFKPFFGKVEGLPNERLFPVLVFRAILYSAIILALTLGM